MRNLGEVLYSQKPGDPEKQALKVWFQETEGAMKYGEFELKVHRTYRGWDIPRAKAFISADQLLRDEHMFGVAVGELVRAIEELGMPFDAIAGVPTGGTRLAEQAREHMRKFPDVRVISVKKNTDGSFELLDSPSPGTRVILIEDVMTTGESLKALIKILQDAQCVVVAAVALVDREQYGKERIKIPVKAVMRLEEMLPGDRRDEVMNSEREINVVLAQIFEKELTS